MKYKIILFTLIALGYSGFAQKERPENKMMQTMQYINRFYVENPNMEKIVEKGVESMLRELDPHSVYIPEKDVERSNEALVGNFDGIGVAFQIMKDTINIVEVIRGGPSEKLGLLAGDKIVTIDGNEATGDTISNNFVFKKLRGKKGSQVKLGIKRGGIERLFEFNVTRDKIPIYSIDTYFMIDNHIGYIRLDRFSRTSADEFRAAIKELKDKGMKNLIFDLRGNGGGYLDIAVDLADEFLGKDKLIVYTEGLSHPRQSMESTVKGSFEKGKLVILIDENSASASEIVSGAVQDWDRGLVVGRRSFGKGLVQRVFPFSDGAQMRLTTSRYYTPSGRCIQKPYNDGLDAYYKDLMNRYNHKEMVNPDSITLPDSVKYYTNAKRVVYGGGGIMPDIFVPMDTMRLSDYYLEIRGKGLINTFTLEYANTNREKLLSKYPTYEEFNKHYKETGINENFLAFVEKSGVRKNYIKPDWVIGWINETLKKEIKDTVSPIKGDSYSDYTELLIQNPNLLQKVLERAKQEDIKSNQMIEKSNEFLLHQIKALVARNLYGTRYYYEAMKDMDEGYKAAIEIMNDDKLFKTYKISY